MPGSIDNLSASVNVAGALYANNQICFFFFFAVSLMKGVQERFIRGNYNGEEVDVSQRMNEVINAEKGSK